MNLFYRAIMLLAAAACPFSAAFSQQYPTHAIRLIAPYAPGGGSDLLARMIGQQLSTKLGQSVVVENRPGAGGVVGTQVVVGADPDGYTLLLTAPSPIVVMPHMMTKISYDPLKDLAPITLIAEIPALLVVNPAVPVHSVAELIALARKEPGKLTFSSSGLGGTAQLAGELMKTMTGVNMLHIPYKGTGPANTAVLTNEVTMSFSDMIATLHFVQDGKMRALAVTTLHRSPFVPDLPAMSETLPGFDASVWYGVFAPAKTPQPIIDQLNRALVEIMKAPDFKKRLGELGADPIANTPAQYAEFLRVDDAKWSKVIKEAHMTAD